MRGVARQRQRDDLRMVIRDGWVVMRRAPRVTAAIELRC